MVNLVRNDKYHIKLYNKKFKVIEMNWYEDHMGKGKKDPYLTKLKNPYKPANIWESTDKLNYQYYRPALEIVCS